MPDPLKYAIVERERRFVEAIPTGVSQTVRITDRYVVGTRLRLREAVTSSGEVTRKLGHKVRLTDGPAEVACTSMYLDDDEWRLLCELPATVLHKTRHRVERDGFIVAVDELADGTLLLRSTTERHCPTSYRAGSKSSATSVTTNDGPASSWHADQLEDSTGRRADTTVGVDGQYATPMWARW